MKTKSFFQTRTIIRILAIFFIGAACGDGNNVSVVDKKECTYDTDCVDAVGDYGTCIQGSCQFGDSKTQSAVECIDNEIECNNECLVCDRPPEGYCKDNGTYVRYTYQGTCNTDTGDCTYQMTEETCTECYKNCEYVCQDVTCKDINGGCQINGHCTAPNRQPICEYYMLPDRTICELSNTPENSQKGLCQHGQCVQCVEANDCNDGDNCTIDICTANNRCYHDVNPECVDPDPDPSCEKLEDMGIYVTFTDANNNSDVIKYLQRDGYNSTCFLFDSDSLGTDALECSVLSPQNEVVANFVAQEIGDDVYVPILLTVLSANGNTYTLRAAYTLVALFDLGDDGESFFGNLYAENMIGGPSPDKLSDYSMQGKFRGAYSAETE